MKIRALLAGVVLALAVGACAADTILPDGSTPVPSFDGSTPPPPDTAADRSGGGMGSGN